MPLLLLLLACVPGAGPDSGLDTGAVAPLRDADVLVIGAGSAGQSAALAAREAGAAVLLLDMAERGGGSGWYAGNFFAAGTRWQAEAGIEDSVEKALSEWESFTGGDPQDPMVEAFVAGSGETLEWLEQWSGVPFNGAIPEVDAGSVARTHGTSGPDLTDALVLLLQDVLHPLTRADALLVEDGQVVGARVTDLASGEEQDLRAGAVVMATGGFARDRTRLDQDQPLLVGHTVVPEAALVSLGAGHPLLEAIGAGWQNQGNYGWYLHSTVDFRTGTEGEALLMMDLPYALVVDLDGHRLMNEDEMAFGLSSFHRLLQAPDARAMALFDTAFFDTLSAEVPGYNWAENKEWVPAADLVSAGLARPYADLGQLAAREGVDSAGLEATVSRYNELAELGSDADFGKSKSLLMPLGPSGFTIMEIVPGAAKAFTGVALDASTRVLDGAGQPIPGLYAAGEVAGMLGTAATGRGFSGSLTACHFTGRLAGRTAAEWALAP